MVWFGGVASNDHVGFDLRADNDHLSILVSGVEQKNNITVESIV